nr:OmpA family protein [Vibrio hepatarius]
MFDQYRLTSSQHQVLKQYVELVGDDVDIVVEGHADNTGTERYNKWLSERRTREVALYLKDSLKLGNRIKLVAFGETSPACSIPENKRNGCNRRVVLSLKS